MKNYLNDIQFWLSKSQLNNVKHCYTGFIQYAHPTTNNFNHFAKAINNNLTIVKDLKSTPADICNQLTTMDKLLEIIVKHGKPEIGGRIQNDNKNLVIILLIRSQEKIICECLSLISSTALRKGLLIIPKSIKATIGSVVVRQLISKSINYAKTLVSIPVKNMSKECIGEKYEYTGITNSGIPPEPVSFEQCAKNSGTVAMCPHKRPGRYMIILPKISQNKVRYKTGRFLDKISYDSLHLFSNECRAKFGSSPCISNGSTVSGCAVQLGQEIINSFKFALNEDDPPTQVITTFTDPATVNPTHNSSYFEAATLALPSASIAAPQATDHNVNTFSTKSDDMSKITMDDIKT